MSPHPAHASDSAPPPERVAAVDHSDEHLARLGYQTWTRRRWNGFANWAISASIISVVTGVFSLYGFDMVTGGPAETLYGWIGVALATLLVALSMAEICALYPTSGALYYWASQLAPRRSAAKWGWYTAHLNFTGQVAGAAAVDYAAAQFLQALLSLRWSGYTATPGRAIAIFLLILAVQAVVNVYAGRSLATINKAAMWWMFGSILAITLALWLIPGHHQSAGYALTGTFNGSGFHSGIYVAAIGLTLGGYTLTGMDASGHMSEETKNPERNASTGIVRAVYLSAIAGLALLLALNFATQNYAAEAAAGTPPVQILLDALGPNWTQLLLVAVLGCMLTCGLAGLTAGSRMAFAVSRDGVLPFHTLWRRTSARRGVPVPAVWLVAGLSFLLGLTTFIGQGNVVFNALTSVTVIGEFTAYGIPIFLRLRRGGGFTADKSFSLGRFGRPIGCLAVGWVVVLDLIACMPQFTPVGPARTWPFASALLAAVLLASTIGWWIRRARGNAFTGPTRDVTPEYLEQFPEVVF
jgi:amino acid transporter